MNLMMTVVVRMVGEISVWVSNSIEEKGMLTSILFRVGDDSHQMDHKVVQANILIIGKQEVMTMILITGAGEHVEQWSRLRSRKQIATIL